MATFSLTPTRPLPSSSSSSSPSILQLRHLSTPSAVSFNPIHHDQLKLRASTLDFSGSFFDGGFDEEPPSPPPVPTAEDKVEPQCPPGLRQYETMAVLRPDMTEDERLLLIQRYEEIAQVVNEKAMKMDQHHD